MDKLRHVKCGICFLHPNFTVRDLVLPHHDDCIIFVATDIKADFDSVQFSKCSILCDRFLLDLCCQLILLDKAD